MDMHQYNPAHDGAETIDLMMPQDAEMDDGPSDEAHHRRGSYHHSDEDLRHGDRADIKREPSPHGRRSIHDSERRHESEQRDHRSSRDHPQDDKYDRRPSASDRNGRRSRSRSPARGGAAGAGAGAVRDRRVYVGNLAYDVKWTHLKDFMREIGPVAHADVLLGHDGRSKGCGVVEFQSAQDAQTAIRKLNDVVLMGRPIFVREDRESESRIGFSGGRGSLGRDSGRDSGRDMGRDAGRDAGRDSGRDAGSTRQIYVANLPYSVDWRELKDFFRKAGPVDRADVFMNRENRSKGSGTVSFDSSRDVGRAISMFNGYEWHGRRIEVREDKFGPSAGGARSAAPPPSSYRGESYGYGRDYRDDSRSGRDHHGNDLYTPSAPVSHSSHANHSAYGGNIPSGPAAGSGDQIYIRNLPLTTTNQDLKELFRSCGPMKTTEILESGGRSKGSGIVRFEHFESADKAVVRFNGYIYGGRSLEVMYDRA